MTVIMGPQHLGEHLVVRTIPHFVPLPRTLSLLGFVGLRVGDNILYHFLTGESTFVTSLYSFPSLVRVWELPHADPATQNLDTDGRPRVTEPQSCFSPGPCTSPASRGLTTLFHFHRHCHLIGELLQLSLSGLP